MYVCVTLFVDLFDDRLRNASLSALDAIPYDIFDVFRFAAILALVIVGGFYKTKYTNTMQHIFINMYDIYIHYDNTIMHTLIILYYIMLY